MAKIISNNIFYLIQNTVQLHHVSIQFLMLI